MEIKGFVPTSLVDWDGKVVSVIFVSGCNFRCGYCSNKDLVLHPENLKSIELKYILEYLGNNKEFIDGVVISGGEPTLYSETVKLCEEIKKLGFKIKLDTNGSNPEILKEFFLDKNLVDYVAMDIKTNFEKYKELTNSDIDVEKIKKSIFIVSQFPEYEFRITLSPSIKKEDLL
ncbi:MAG: anaerobic ribonucleoside-triphosphate reductase activating protein, partial [Nanoarchaeota archaeon]